MVKQKAEHQRFYDKDGYKKRAACVCVKNENENEVNIYQNKKILRIYLKFLNKGPVNIK